MIIEEEAHLAHYGILRKSGRYPWGSGESQSERNRTFLDTVDGLKKQGMSDTEICRGFSTPDAPFTTTMLRAAKSIAKNEEKQTQINMAQRLKDKGWGPSAIGERMKIPESSVRALLKPGEKDKLDVLHATSKMLAAEVAKKRFIDIGVGAHHQLGISETKLSNAVALLKEQGYTVHVIQVDQLGTNKKTLVKVLAAEGTTYKDIVSNKDQIHQIREFSNDGGRSYLGLQTPIHVSSKRIAVRYAEQGGTDADGVIYVRPNVKDLSLGGDRYAQVRISVDGTHYLKGMAIYKGDLPAGVDLMFNTNKSNTGSKLDAMKPQKINKETGDIDSDNPFGSVVRQIVDPSTGKVTSAMNKVNGEGDWDTWGNTLSSQALSKQSPALAKSQLNMTYSRKREELDEIMALTNPAVKKKLLEEYSDGADSSAVHLKAAAIPRQATQVILPVNQMKPTEIYAPNFNDGERVALIRYPHGGIFEIPELTVNNRNPHAKKLLGQSKDAVGIHSKVAERLSGADFDGDTVLVIPNNDKKIKTSPPLEGLLGFDPQRSYPAYPGMKRMTAQEKAFQMGDVSNLITDMTIKGANHTELARAVRHSMVVIDAEKHNLDYKQSAADNGIKQLKVKYQGKANAGAATLISKATSREDVDKRKLRSAAQGGSVDKATGRLIYEKTGESYVDSKGKTIFKKERSTKLAETEDAHSLSSGTMMEKIYADHSNKMKALANEARKAAVHVTNSPVSVSAKTAYATEVASLNHKLAIAQENAPRERQAQLLANTVVSQKRQADPDMDPSDVKKIKGQALTEMRLRTGAKKTRIEVTDDEWNAIQSGAISTNKLNQILNNADMDRIKQLATPKQQSTMTGTMRSRAVSMMNQGYTQAEVAGALGVSVSTLKRELS